MDLTVSWSPSSSIPRTFHGPDCFAVSTLCTIYWSRQLDISGFSIAFVECNHLHSFQSQNIFRHAYVLLINVHCIIEKHFMNCFIKKHFMVRICESHNFAKVEFRGPAKCSSNQWYLLQRRLPWEEYFNILLRLRQFSLHYNLLFMYF